ncbi:type VI secretion system baseplate subunit TssK [Chitiniphilus purpureus]|uniref:Type VI secretion system baseplate subunit TssK n=1 Tax=Chitiniphilus purpureus TaxID=2981137 RepID=A0ABY6DS89_9NEIS|nr:type VI secretion system baseplate subunit TssK [Chitiniphilus sp. CD1]UXY17250.1 type VI secretion system baseplate subunit TssK [Chitiniphilus sp. CD1]
MDIPAPLPDALQWSEGLLLSPQHLQQHDIYLHQQLTHRLLCQNRHFWGIRELRLDQARIGAGVLAVEYLDCLLPDGLAVRYAAGYGQGRLEIDLKAQLEQRGEPVRVWLAVPVRGATAAAQGSAVQRFDAVPGELMADENTGEGEIEVHRLRPRLRLIADKSLPPSYVGCPVAELCSERGLIRLTRYHPPLLRMGASGFLNELGLDARLRLLTLQVWSKVRLLAGGRSDAAQEEALSDEERRCLVVARQLAQPLPALEVAVAGGDTHPHALYGALMPLLGAAAGIGNNPVPPVPEPYQHLDCVAQFEQAIAFIEAKLALIDTQYDSDAFEQVGEAEFVKTLPERGGEVLIELKPRAGQTLTGLAHWLTECRIGSEELMPLLYARRLPGAAVRALSRSEIVMRKLRPGGAFFVVQNQELEVNDKLVQAYLPGRRLKIAGLRSGDAPAAILLYRNKHEGGDEAQAIPTVIDVLEPHHG